MGKTLGGSTPEEVARSRRWIVAAGALLPALPLWLAACSSAGPPAAPGPPAASAAADAAPVEWVRSLAGAGREYAAALAVDREGNAYAVGYLHGESDLAAGRLTSAGENDVLLARFDPAGEIVWVRSFGGPGADEARGAAAGPDGVCATGFFSGSADFDPGPGRTELASAGSADAFVACLDREGGLRWARRLGGKLGDVGAALAIDAGGNVYVTGYFQGSADFDPGAGAAVLQSAGRADAFVVKLDAAGGLLWARRIGGAGEDQGRGIEVDAAGGAVLAGSFEETAGFGPEGGELALASAGRTDALVARLDGSGRLRWAAALGGSGADVAEEALPGAGGAVYAAGRFSGTADFDPGPASSRLESAGSTDVFAVRLDGAGRLGWARQLGGPADDFAVGIAGAADGLWVAGLSQPSAAQAGASTASFLARLDAAGSAAATDAARNEGNLQILAVEIGPAGAPYVAGVYQGRAALHASGRVHPLAAAARIDAFVARLAGLAPSATGSRISGPASWQEGAVVMKGSRATESTGHTRRGR